jgi:hypothetical protein
MRLYETVRQEGVEGLQRVAAFERKDVWMMLWATDNADLLASMERTYMYIFRYKCICTRIRAADLKQPIAFHPLTVPLCNRTVSHGSFCGTPAPVQRN